MNHRKKIIAFSAAFVFTILIPFSYAAATQPVVRYAVIAGSNSGGDKERLKYAVSDAESMSKVFSELGGLPRENIILLKEPDPGELLSAFADIKKSINKQKSNSRRVELLFYYSGHSDEKGLVLNRGIISFADLKHEIRSLPSDIKIAIIDSCSSGMLIRMKGGERMQPFLLDNSIDLTGSAFISSSSDTEASQESDHIRGSFFTHCLATGLRGAADADSNGKVTLNEAYQYAFRETLLITRNYKSGAQHPGYDIQMKGAGDLILTDISAAESGLRIGGEVTGKLFIYDSPGNLVAELNKKNDPITLGLSPGEYAINLEKDESNYQAKVSLERDRTVIVKEDNFILLKRDAAAGKPFGIQKISLFAQPFYSTIFGDLKENLKPDAGIQVTGSFDIDNFNLNPAAVLGFQKNNADDLSVFYTAIGLGYQLDLHRKISALFFLTVGFSAGKFTLSEYDYENEISYSQSIILPGVIIFYNLNKNFSLSLSVQSKYFIDTSIVFGTYDALIGIGYRI